MPGAPWRCRNTPRRRARAAAVCAGDRAPIKCADQGSPAPFARLVTSPARSVTPAVPGRPARRLGRLARRSGSGRGWAGTPRDLPAGATRRPARGEQRPREAGIGPGMPRQHPRGGRQTSAVVSRTRTQSRSSSTISSARQASAQAVAASATSAVASMHARRICRSCRGGDAAGSVALSSVLRPRRVPGPRGVLGLRCSNASCSGSCE